MNADDRDRQVQRLKTAYGLQRHLEGGWFAPGYTSAARREDRPVAGSIYFLLDRTDQSHFHQLDCDEIWYYHAGCGLKIYVIFEGRLRICRLGIRAEREEQPMAAIPAGAIFAAENLDREGYTFISCATAPQFVYQGFRLIPRQELKTSCPDLPDEVLDLAYENPPA